MSKVRVDINDIEKALDKAANELGLYIDGKEPVNKTLYSMLSKRYPIFTGSNIPAAAKQNLLENDTCACADASHVYLDLEQYKKVIEDASEDRNIYADSEHIRADLCDLIIHEYTHILMQHLRKICKFNKQSKNAKNMRTFSLACEIEANRGYDMRTWANIYAMGVTESAFPEVRGVYGLQNIYKKLKEKYGDDIDEYMNEQEQQQEGCEEGEEESTNKSSKLSEKQKELLDKFKEDFEQQEKQAKEMQKSMPSESDEDAEEGEGASISGGGSGSTEEDYMGAYEALKAYTSKHNQEQIKQDLSKLKGILSGSDVSIGRQKSYSRPPRRDCEGNLMKKGVKKGHHKAPRILIGMDSSGSMQSTTMKQVLNAISDIIKATGREMQGSYICEHDCYVKHLSPLHEYQKVVAGYRPDGGNNFNALLRAALSNDVQAVINVGDGWDDLSDPALMAQAKSKGLKWVDVIISDRVEKFEIEAISKREARYFGDDYIGRTILKLK